MGVHSPAARTLEDESTLKYPLGGLSPSRRRGLHSGKHPESRFRVVAIINDGGTEAQRGDLARVLAGLRPNPPHGCDRSRVPLHPLALPLTDTHLPGFRVILRSLSVPTCKVRGQQAPSGKDHRVTDFWGRVMVCHCAAFVLTL